MIKVEHLNSNEDIKVGTEEEYDELLDNDEIDDDYESWYESEYCDVEYLTFSSLDEFKNHLRKELKYSFENDSFTTWETFYTSGNNYNSGLKEIDHIDTENNNYFGFGDFTGGNYDKYQICKFVDEEDQDPFSLDF